MTDGHAAAGQRKNDRIIAVTKPALELFTQEPAGLVAITKRSLPPADLLQPPRLPESAGRSYLQQP